MKKFTTFGLSAIMAGAFAFAPLVSVAQVENTASVLAGLKQQVRVLQELVVSLQARFAALGKSSMAQVSAGVTGVAESHATSTPDVGFIINDTISSSFRLGAANPGRAYTQSFTAPMDGKLKLIKFAIAAPQNGNPTKPINVSLRTAIAGTVLASETIIPTLPVSKTLQMPTYVTVNFTNPATLQKNSTYYVEYAVAAPYDSKNYYRLIVGEGDPYKDGALYHANGQKIAVYDMVMTVGIGSNMVTGGELKISPVQGLDKTVIAGSMNVSLGGFDVMVKNEPVVISKISLTPLVSLPSPSTVTNLSLYKTSGELVAGPFDMQNGMFTFTDLFKLPVGTSTLLVKGNVSAGTPNNTTIRFGTNPSTDWHAKGEMSGVDIVAVPNSIVSCVPVTVIRNGGWAVSLAPAGESEKWVVAGSTNVPMSTLRFTATTEDFALTKLRLGLKPDATATDVAKIHLYDGATLIASKVPSFVNGVEDFSFPMSGAGSFIIPKDSHKEMTIKIDVPCIGSLCSGRAGQPVAVDFKGSDTSKNKAVGMSSGMEVHTSTAFDVGGPGVRYFRSLPTVERLAIPVTALTSGNQVLYKFKITANPAYDVALHKVVFAVLPDSDARVSNITLRNVTDARRVSATLPSPSPASTAIIFADNTDLPGGQCTITACWDIIPAGSVRTYELRADVTTDGSGDSISTKLLGDIALPPIKKLKMVSVSELQSDDYNSMFIWSDFSSDATTTHSIYTADWMNGYKVPGLLSTGLDSSTLSN